MFCPKCGNQNPDDAKVCGNCGAMFSVPQQPVTPVQPVTPEQPVAPVQPVMPEQPVMPGMNMGMPQPAPKKSNKGIIIAVICVVVAIAVGVGAFFIFGNKGDKSSSKEDTEASVVETNATPEKVAEKFVNSQFEFDAEGIMECWHEKMIEVLAEEDDMTVSEFKQTFIEEANKGKKETEDEYGGFAVSDVKTVSSEKLTGEDFEDLKEEIEEEYGLTVSEAYEVEVTYNLTMESLSGTKVPGKVTVYAGKIGSTWYVVDYEN